MDEMQNVENTGSASPNGTSAQMQSQEEQAWTDKGNAAVQDEPRR